MLSKEQIEEMREGFLNKHEIKAVLDQAEIAIALADLCNGTALVIRIEHRLKGLEAWQQLGKELQAAADKADKISIAPKGGSS